MDYLVLVASKLHIQFLNSLIYLKFINKSYAIDFFNKKKRKRKETG